MRTHSLGFYCRLKLTLLRTPPPFSCENVLWCDITGDFLFLLTDYLRLSVLFLYPLTGNHKTFSPSFMGTSYCLESYFYCLQNASGCSASAFSLRIRLQVTWGVTRGAVLSLRCYFISCCLYLLSPLCWITQCLWSCLSAGFKISVLLPIIQQLIKHF